MNNSVNTWMNNNKELFNGLDEFEKRAKFVDMYPGSIINNEKLYNAWIRQGSTTQAVKSRSVVGCIINAVTGTCRRKGGKRNKTRKIDFICTCRKRGSKRKTSKNNMRR